MVLIITALALLIMGAFYHLFIKKDNNGIMLLAIVLFLCAGYGRMNQVREKLDTSRANLEASQAYSHMSGSITRITKKENSLLLTLSDVDADLDGNHQSGLKMLVYLKEEDLDGLLSQELCIGMRIEVWGRVEAFTKARNPGEFDFDLYYRSLKMDGRMFGDQIQILDDHTWPYFDFLRKASEYGKQILDDIADPVGAGIFQAAILGNKDSLDAQIRDLYQKTGIAHLLAISGLHLSILGRGLYQLFRKVGAGYGGAGCMSTVLVISYGILTGGSSSVLRAVIMLLCSFLAEFMGRTYDLLSAASLSAFLLTLDSPYFLTQGGFQLSFGAIYAIGFLAPYLEIWLKPQYWWQKTLTASIAIQLVTAPVILYHFFQYPMYGILLNFLVIPLMAFVICSGIAGIVLGSIFHQAGVMAVGTGHYILLLYYELCRWFSALPGSSLILGRPGRQQIILYYGLLFIISAAVRAGRFTKQKGRTVWRWILLLAFSGAGLLILKPASVHGLKVTFLDVGQGDGIVIQTGNKTILVDGGSSSEKKLGEYRLEPFLKSQGINRIDYAFISHSDQDHINGFIYLLESCDDIMIDSLFLSCLGGKDESDLKLKELMESRGGVIYEFAAGDRVLLGDLELSCIYPAWGDYASDKNEQSEVIRVDYKGFHMLLTGDMSEACEKNILERQSVNTMHLNDIQVLKAAHHGSKTASGDDFLNALNPAWAVISYAEGNTYGHPHEEVLKRFEKRGIKVWKTGESGAITLNTDGKTISWDTFIK